MAAPRFEPIALDLARRVSAVSLLPLRGEHADLRAATEEDESHCQNFRECHAALVGAARQLLGAPQFGSLARLHDTLEAEFQPQGPPHSPVCPGELTQLILGQAPQGLAGETPFSVLQRLVEIEPRRAFLLPLLRSMAGAHWDLYRVAGVAGDQVQLTSLRTGEECSVHQRLPWLRSEDGALARVLQFGTRGYLADPPYLLRASGSDWQAYLERVEQRNPTPPARASKFKDKKKSKRRAPAKERDCIVEHLHGGTPLRFWLDYVVAGYAGERDGVVWLQGVPDRTESLAHPDVLNGL